jgi:hypothetical protein
MTSTWTVTVHSRTSGNSEPLGTVEAETEKIAQGLAEERFRRTATERHGNRCDLLVERVRTTKTTSAAEVRQPPSEQRRWLDLRTLPYGRLNNSVQVNIVPELESGLDELAEEMNPTRHDVRLQRFNQRRGR